MGQAFDIKAPGVRRRLKDITLNTVEAGPEDGPLVILLHGFPEFWWGWRYQIGPLVEAGFRVVAPDQRGYNLSNKPQGRRAYHIDTLAKDVIELADALGRETFHVVGHDWGGLVAWWTASRYPERVAKLVAINAPHPSVVGPYMRSHPRQMARSLYAGFFQLPFLPEAALSANGYRSLKQALVRSGRSGTFSEDDLRHYEETWSRSGALTAMINWYRALPLAPTREVLRTRLSMPVRVLWGVDDPFLEKGLAEDSLALCDNGTALWVEKAGHFVQHEEPDLINRALVDFLKA